MTAQAVRPSDLPSGRIAFGAANAAWFGSKATTWTRKTIVSAMHPNAVHIVPFPGAVPSRSAGRPRPSISVPISAAGRSKVSDATTRSSSTLAAPCAFSRGSRSRVAICTAVRPCVQSRQLVTAPLTASLPSQPRVATTDRLTPLQFAAVVDDLKELLRAGALDSDERADVLFWPRMSQRTFQRRIRTHCKERAFQISCHCDPARRPGAGGAHVIEVGLQGTPASRRLTREPCLSCQVRASWPLMRRIPSLASGANCRWPWSRPPQ